MRRLAMALATHASRDKKEQLSLVHAAQYLLDESRMVLPGMQALFGFQMIAVFSNGFGEQLNAFEQSLHLVAIVLVAISIALIMAPAAFHRQTGPQQVSQDFVHLSTRLLLFSMPPLALGVSIDFYLVARVIVGSGWVA